jgi:hypothetical protein
VTPVEGSGVPADADSLQLAATTLASIAELPLERHPEAFARFDELLRDALEVSPHVSSG